MTEGKNLWGVEEKHLESLGIFSFKVPEGKWDYYLTNPLLSTPATE